MRRTLTSITSPFADERVFLVEDTETQKFRGEEYTVHVCYYEGEKTKEQFTTTEMDERVFHELYNQYRAAHGIPFPDEIREIREGYGLSLAQITRIVGFGQNQWRQYESGRMPSESNARSIVAAADKDAFLRMVEASRQEIGEKEYARVREKVSRQQRKGDGGIRLFLYGDTRRDMLNGFAPCDPARLTAMVCLLVSQEPQGTVKTKLNKEMFYADFVHYRTYGQSISGLRYQAIQFGPVPYHYDTIYDNIPQLAKVPVLADDLEYSILKAEEPDTSVLSQQETETILMVSRRLAPLSRKEAVVLAHGETAWQRHKDTHSLIPYSEAFTIKAL